MAVGQIISRAIAQGAVTSDDIGALEITHAKLHTDMDLSSKTVTMPAVIRGPATLTIDPAAVGDNTGTLVIAGDLQVDGTTTTINSTTMTVDDKNLVLASGAGNASAADGAGVTIDGASATMLYTHATTSFDFNKPVNIAGNLGVTGTVDGVDIAARDAVLTSTTTTANAALPKSGGTMTGVIAGFESTGIDDNATDTVITVQQNGMVGIGIDGPGARLTLGGTAGAADNSSVMLIALGATQKTYFGTANATGNIITGSSSGDTVLRSNGHNILFSVDSGSSSAVYIKSDGKVGIGETSPLGKLHVKDGDAGSITTNGAHDTIIVEGSANTGINIFSPSTSYQYLAFGDPGGSNRGYVRYQHSIDQMVLRAGGTDTVFINGGNVGIGADSPNEMLHIEATNPKIRLLNNSTGGSGLEWWNDYGGSDHINSSIGWNEGSANWEFKNYRADGQSGSPYGNIDFLNGSTTSPTLTLRIATNNNVAIGHSSPTDKLDVQGADNGITIRSASAHRPKLSLINDSSTMLTLSANGTYAAIGDGADANRYMSFRSGKVGIGTTSPSYKFHAVDDSSNTDPESDLGVYYGFLNSNASVNTGSAILLGSNNNSGSAIYAQRIGANNEHKLGIQVRNSAGSSTTHLTVMGSGNVGIGAGAPSTLLDLQTPGNTVDGGYYSTMTINNTGSGTWSRLRFDRSNSAKWGISLGTDDKLKISNLDVNGGGGANDGALVIDNTGKVSINSQTAYAKFYVSGGVMAHAFDNGGNWRSLGSFGAGSGQYCHVKTTLTYNSYRMTTFRATGFLPYSAIGHGYLGCYTYGATPGSPYGQANFNLGNHAIAYSQYYASDSSLVLVWNWATTYDGFWLEYISTGGTYGNVIDVNVVAATNSNSTSGVY